ncbi:AAA family ATPase [Eubacterium callanderi]|uniref:AAA family ATPase n=1 Tax=Eubacterium callanderi TaxID=53442 RepID=UPI001D086C03|nr:ATP-binding protein [Eubacterium callanderi]MCB6660262.1 AAA family ATPase [Eubacterium callanderi]MCB6753205.1 AAA family ATPase [Eubacterium callanderi]MCB7105085.1 AAA family ATPase [Eubacterium callanderi]MCG4820572.1 AAA family ATPase [Eubacterium callanderi]MCQ5190446.1 AAA family ATPase [Eubacterium callanderi]
MIKEIKWKDYSVLKNLKLNFEKDDGSIYNTVILAGENGTGKTTILETLATFLNLGSFKPFEYIRYDVEDSKYKITQNQETDSLYGYHNRIKENGESIKEFVSQSSDINDKADIRYYGCVYSKARSGFITQKIISTTNQQLDNEKYVADQNEDFTSIKQLIVDIDTQDNAEWMEITTSSAETSFEEFKKTSRMYRFKDAFNNFFDTIKFNKVDNTDPDEKKILFEKHGNTISIDELSTGEKQIVFRGAYLLKNINGISNGVVLIDEPELSMHPKWQQKILNYYRDLFTDNGNQKVQLIIATHSEYVLRSALENPDDILIITLNDYDGIVKDNKISAPTVLPSITAAETNYIAFGISSTDYHIELYGWLQSKTGKGKIKECDDYIKNDPNYDKSKHEKVDIYKKTAYNTLPTYIRNAIDHPDSNRSYTPEELEVSIKLLQKLCK